MKTLFLLALSMLATSLAAQDCKLKKTTDPYTKLTKISSGFKRFGQGSTSFLLSVDATAAEIDLFFSVPGPAESQCFDNNSPAVFTYEGGRIKYNAKNSGSVNCEGLFHVTFKNTATTPGALNNLAIKKLQSIKLTNKATTATEVTLTPEEQEKFMRLVSCVAAEAKTLLK